MLRSKRVGRKLTVVAIAMATAVLAGAGQATAEARYHLLTIPEISAADAISDSGVILAGSILVEPARDGAGDPVWDSDGDDIVDGYTITTLDPGPYVSAGGSSINESLDVVGSGTDANGDQVALLWWNAPGGRTLVELGATFTYAEMQTFTDGVQINALSINDLGQILVYEHGADYSVLPDPSDTFALALVNPKDTDADGAPDLWFEDADSDGANDLMVELQYGTRLGGDLWGEGCINNLGQVAARSNLTGRGFVVLPKDTDGDGEPDLWFEDLDEDGLNDLETDLGPSIDEVALSDSGVIVGSEIVYGDGDRFLRWQIDESGNVELVAEESGAYFMTGANNLGEAVGYTVESTKRGLISSSILWEPDLSIVDLLDLLDNPSRTAENPRAFDISNTGYIVGDLTDDYPVTVGFIAVPISQNAPPAVSISSPQDGATFDSGVTINFSGTANDPEDGDLTDSLVWTSNIDGEIGTGGSYSTTLSDGIHTITASATDSGGRTGSDSIGITVGTSTPEVSVDSITPDTMPRGTSIDVIITGSGFQAGASVTFENGKVPAPTADVTSVGGTTIEATVTVPSKAKVGVSWDVRVTNPDSSSGVLVDGLTVTP